MRFRYGTVWGAAHGGSGGVLQPVMERADSTQPMHIDTVTSKEGLALSDHVSSIMIFFSPLGRQGGLSQLHQQSAWGLWQGRRQWGE